MNDDTTYLISMKGASAKLLAHAARLLSKRSGERYGQPRADAEELTILAEMLESLEADGINDFEA